MSLLGNIINTCACYLDSWLPHNYNALKEIEFATEVKKAEMEIETVELEIAQSELENAKKTKDAYFAAYEKQIGQVPPRLLEAPQDLNTYLNTIGARENRRKVKRLKSATEQAAALFKENKPAKIFRQRMADAIQERYTAENTFYEVHNKLDDVLRDLCDVNMVRDQLAKDLIMKTEDSPKMPKQETRKRKREVNDNVQFDAAALAAEDKPKSLNKKSRNS